MLCPRDLYIGSQLLLDVDESESRNHRMSGEKSLEYSKSFEILLMISLVTDCIPLKTAIRFVVLAFTMSY